MITHNVVQGSEEWNALRARPGIKTASEAPVIMAASSKIKRNELLAIKAGYSEKEYSDWVQKNLFDKGHAMEAATRPIIEDMIGEGLYPVTGTNGDFLASYDGLTLMEDTGFEHKMLNPELEAMVNAKELTPEYYWQLEHQLLVCESMERVIFVASDGTSGNLVWMEYRAVPGRREELIRGWQQFDKDLANYQHEVIPAKPEAEAIESFPALAIALVGEVKSSNLPVYRNRALAFIESINTDLQTDQDFVNAEEAVKFCDKAEKEIDLVKKQALAQTHTIDELFCALDSIKDSMRKKRLMLDKLVKERKEQIRTEIVNKARQTLLADISAANDEFRPMVVVSGITADFAAAIKGKRTIESLRNAASDELTRARLALAKKRDHIRACLKIIQGAGSQYRSLFHDTQSLVEKEPDHLALIVKQRVDEHEAAKAAEIEAAAQKRAQEIADEQKRQADALAEQQRKEAEAEAERQREVATQAAPAKTDPAPDQQLSTPVAQLATQQAATARVNPVPVQAASPAQQPAAPQAKQRVVAMQKSPEFRPKDSEIISVLSQHFGVDERKVISWLWDMDLQELSENVA